MPHALTPRQREYLDFIRDYIQQNESSPRLDDIAEHFKVKRPTAHKALEALQSKGYLYFGRDRISGFFIRLQGSADGFDLRGGGGRRVGETHAFSHLNWCRDRVNPANHRQGS